MEDGLPQRVPAAIVDKDGSAISRGSLKTSGVQMVDLVEDCNSFTQARRGVQSGKVFGFFLIPEDFQADLLAGRKPVITFYTNTWPTSCLPPFCSRRSRPLRYTPRRGLRCRCLMRPGQRWTRPRCFHACQHHQPPARQPWTQLCDIPLQLFRVDCNQLMIFLITCFSLGQEIEYGTSRRLLRMADGSILKALAAKLLPQTVIWLVLVIFMESWLFRWNGYPMHGSWWWLTLSEVVFVLASQGMGVFFFGLLPNLRLSLSISALVGVLSFSLAAFSFPVESISCAGHIQLGASDPLQLPHLHRPGSQRHSGLLFKSMVCGLYRLYASAVHYDVEHQAVRKASGLCALKCKKVMWKYIKSRFGDLVRSYFDEFRLVFHDGGIILFFCFLPLAYPIIYSLIYNPEVVRDVKMVVVDRDRTSKSRELVRSLDACQEIRITGYAADLDEAKRAMHGHDCYGILEIPDGFSKRLGRGEQSPAVIYSGVEPAAPLQGIPCGGHQRGAGNGCRAS